MDDLDLDARIEEIERILDDDRRIADPGYGVSCALGCSERPCRHTAALVEAIKREEDDR